jgi:hypothetical protein
MKRILILTLALWTGTANFAYLAARVECASMMKSSVPMQKGEHSCCPAPVPCQCAIQNPSNDLALPSNTALVIEPMTEGMLLWETTISSLKEFKFEVSAFESPPTSPPLFILFSVQRI